MRYQNFSAAPAWCRRTRRELCWSHNSRSRRIPSRIDDIRSSKGLLCSRLIWIAMAPWVHFGQMKLSCPEQHTCPRCHLRRCRLNTLSGAMSLPKPLSRQGLSETPGNAGWLANYMSERSPGEMKCIMGKNRHQITIPIGAMPLCQDEVPTNVPVSSPAIPHLPC